MHKLMVLFRGREKVSYTAFTDFMLLMARKAADQCHPLKFHITFTDTAPPLASIIPFRRDKVGVLSLYFNDGFSAAGMQQLVEQCRSETGNTGGALVGSYVVEEALPVAYNKDWEDAELTPGVCLLTLFTRKPGLTHAVFVDRWHNSHTPLSLKIHPLWHYSRNVVLERHAPDTEAWEGIVEEHFRKRLDLLNPFSFFGNPFTIIPNMIEVYRDTNAFLDYKTIQTYLVREVVVRS